jgi:phospholipase/carboxylesterase
MLQIKNTTSPHKGQSIVYAGSDIEKSESAMILLHGRGATAESMVDLVSDIYVENMLYVIPQANDYAWYPFRFIERRELNEPGISSGLALINAIIDSLTDKYILREKIFLLGFSQGACLATEFVARYPEHYGGLFALSGGLIGDVINEGDYQGNLHRTPVFFGCSDHDFHIPELRIDESAEVFEGLNADVTKKIYRNLGHTINTDEIRIINDGIQSKHIEEMIRI